MTFWMSGGDHPEFECLPKLMERLGPWQRWKHAMTACLVEVGVEPVPWRLPPGPPGIPGVPWEWLMRPGHQRAYRAAYRLCKPLLPEDMAEQISKETS